MTSSPPPPSGAAGRARVVVLGGGFGGVYTAIHLERASARGAPLRVALVNRDNYMVFQPMLAEVIAGEVGITDTLSPLRQLLRRTEVYVREIVGIDLDSRTVTLAAGVSPREHRLEYDHLVLALGNTTGLGAGKGLAEHALAFKTLADAVAIRNHVIGVLEQASVIADEAQRRAMLTFVIAGGGFSGVEAAASLNGFVRRAIGPGGDYRTIAPDEARIVLVHSGRRVLERELTHGLAEYATRTLREQGVELLLGERLAAASPHGAVLADGRRIATRTLISTVPAAPNPLVAQLSELPFARGRVRCEPTMRVAGQDGIWAVGDCAEVTMRNGEPSPPTAQHAIRQAKVLAANILAAQTGGRQRQFTFTGLGKLGALGHRRAVAELPGRVTVEGPLAWAMWRGIYWAKLPGASRKAKVALSWLSDLALPAHPVQLNLGEGRGARQAHYEPNEVVFAEGDSGESLYMILAGEAEVSKLVQGEPSHIGTLGPGEYFGEMALLGKTTRSATMRAASALDVLVLPGADFAALTSGLTELRGSFEEIARRRAQADAERADVARADEAQANTTREG
jgi:NADH:ubiquinone reductase (H+-translocating)